MVSKTSVQSCFTVDLPMHALECLKLVGAGTVELEPRVGTPTWEWHLPLDIVKKSHFPLWEASGIVGRNPTQFATEWVILSGLFQIFMSKSHVNVSKRCFLSL